MPPRRRRPSAASTAETTAEPVTPGFASPSLHDLPSIATTLTRSTSDVSTRSSTSQSRARSPQFDPHAHDSLSFEDREYHERHRNQLFTNIIATYFLGTKALVQIPSRGRFGNPINPDDKNCCQTKFSYPKCLFGIFWVCYMVAVWYEVLLFLEKYYLSGESPIDEMRMKDPGARYLIYASYFALDAVYPVAFVLLLHFHSSDLLERTERALLKECGPEVYDKVQDKISGHYVKGLTSYISKYIRFNINSFT